MLLSNKFKKEENKKKRKGKKIIKIKSLLPPRVDPSTFQLPRKAQFTAQSMQM